MGNSVGEPVSHFKDTTEAFIGMTVDGSGKK
jgi:hypothetical protein